MLHVFFVITPNVLLLDYAGPAEALRMARDMGAPLKLQACGPVAEVPTSLDTRLTGLAPLPTNLPANSLVLVTGNGNEREDYASDAARQVVRWLRAIPDAGIRLASICSGALLLAQAGLLDGRRCTTHHSLTDDLRALAPGAQVLDDRVFVEDGPVLTSAGITTGIDLALHLVQQLSGPEMAGRVARRLVMYLRRGPNDVQLSPWLAHRNHLHPAVHRAQDLIAGTLAGDSSHRWTLAELADVACVSPRHLTRLFMRHAGISVLDYVQQLRMARAQELLQQQPRLTQEQLAAACGFSSARDWRRVWKRFTTPAGTTGLQSPRAAGADSMH